jgi:hypothetical protein
MFIVEEPNDFGQPGKPGPANDVEDTVTSKIIDFESARKALEQGLPGNIGLEERSWLARRIGVSWSELSLTAVISLALMLFWLAALMWW